MTQFLITSLVLTVALNVGIRLIPGAQSWIANRMRSMVDQPDPTRRRGDLDATGQADTIEGDNVERRNQPRVRVFFPWKAMLIGSIVLTVLINVLGAFR